MAAEALHTPGTLNRRRFLTGTTTAGVTAALACSPAPAAPTSPAGPGSTEAQWEVEWSELVAAARREGTLSVFTIAGLGYRKWMEAAEAALPGISIEHQQLTSSDQLVPKIVAERSSGIYTFDVLITSPVIALPRLRPEGVLEELRPRLFRPDVLDDKAWNGGFEAGWLDNKKALGYAMSDQVSMLAVNTDLVGEGDLRSAQDLLNPKWKGKVLWQDVRSGSTFAIMTSVRLRQGEEAVKRLIIDQEPIFSRDIRQIAEGLVRGRYAIANSLNQANIQEFVDAGLGAKVRFVDVPDVSYINNAFAVWAVDRAPHPNAAKLFINWVLTKEGQEAFSNGTRFNSRRIDVPLMDPHTSPKPGQFYLRVGPEATLGDLDKTQQLLNDLLGIKS